MDDSMPKNETHSSHGSHSQSGKSGEKMMHKYLLGLAILQVILLVVLVFQVRGIAETVSPLKALADAPAQPSAAAGDTVPAAPVDMDALVDDDAIRGEKDAPVTIVEFSDYECPFCVRFFEQTLPSIEKDYVETGKVRIIYRDFPLSFHQQAQKAAEAAECAGEQGKYYEMHDKLFGEGVEGGVATFKQYADDLGLDTKKFDSCLDSGKMASEIQQDQQDGIAAGVQGTPAFFVNGQLISGAQPYAVFQQVIDAALQE